MTRQPIRVATLTLSDTRTAEDDEGGSLLADGLRAAGFEVVLHAILREEPELLREAVARMCDGEHAVDAIVCTGGTGITPRDRTIEALAPMFDKTVDGFGEAFRRLSWDEIGPNAILSRAAMGIVRGKVVAALPGSINAVKLATTRLLAPTLVHAVGLASGRAVRHGAKAGKHAKKEGG